MFRGNAPARIATVGCSEMLETSTAAAKLAPPFVERMEIIEPLKAPTPSEGMINVPFACTSGCVPRPVAPSTAAMGDPQVSPPSSEVLVRRMLLAPKLSHDV